MTNSKDYLTAGKTALGPMAKLVHAVVLEIMSARTLGSNPSRATKSFRGGV